MRTAEHNELTESISRADHPSFEITSVYCPGGRLSWANIGACHFPGCGIEPFIGKSLPFRDTVYPPCHSFLNPLTFIDVPQNSKVAEADCEVVLVKVCMCALNALSTSVARLESRDGLTGLSRLDIESRRPQVGI